MKRIIIIAIALLLTGCANCEFKEVKVMHGKIISCEFQPASAGGYGHDNIDWGFIYHTEDGYHFNSQDRHELGEEISTSKLKKMCGQTNFSIGIK